MPFSLENIVFALHLFGCECVGVVVFFTRNVDPSSSHFHIQSQEIATCFFSLLRAVGDFSVAINNTSCIAKGNFCANSVNCVKYAYYLNDNIYYLQTHYNGSVVSWPFKAGIFG